MNGVGIGSHLRILVISREMREINMILMGIGGAVIKTAKDELVTVINAKKINVLLHCGASVFHDFQRNTENLESHSHTLDDLLEDYSLDRHASSLVWEWIRWGNVPKKTVTGLCYENNIDVMLFTALGTDFWQLFCDEWELIAKKCHDDFYRLCGIIEKDNFTYINMGSSVIMPEVFTKALALIGIDNLKNFKAHVVDFLPNQYRPLTRVSKYGKYFNLTHKEFLQKWLDDELDLV